MDAAHGDLPICDGRPVSIGGWLLLLVSVALAFVALTRVPGGDFPASPMPALLLAAIPLLALLWLATRRLGLGRTVGPYR